MHGNQRAPLINLTSIFNCKVNFTEVIHINGSKMRKAQSKTNASLGKIPSAGTKKGGRPRTLPCVFCDKIFHQNRDLFDHIAIHIEEKPYSCDICGYQCCRKSALNNHVQYKHHNISKYKCRFCQKTFSVKLGLDQHLLRQHPLPGQQVPVFQCNICSKKLSSKANLWTHMQIHSSKMKRIKCGVCSMRFLFKRSLKQHARAHSSDRPLKCEFCDRFFKTKEDMISHIRRIHNREKSSYCIFCAKTFCKREEETGHILHHISEKPYSCNICGREFFTCTNRKEHVGRHSGRKFHKCEICNTSFFSKAILKTHTRNEHTDPKSWKTIQCSECDKIFKTKQGFELHLLAHRNEKPVSCEICDQRFRSTSTRNSHIMRVHGKQEGKHICSLCEKKCLTPMDLRRHLLTHTKEKPYKCHICGRSFTTSVVLKHHQKTHLDIKLRPHKCPVCKRGFTGKGVLKKHLLTHSARRPVHKCAECHQKLLSKGSLTRHMGTAHGATVGAYWCIFCGKVYHERTLLFVHIRKHILENPFSCKYCFESFNTSATRKLHIMGKHKKY